MSPTPHFRIPLNLPHAGTIALRIQFHLQEHLADERVRLPLEELVALLAPIRQEGENPAPEKAKITVERAAVIARAVVDEIERLKAGHDRLGQAVRNLFECLQLGEEGARISLRAGENPDSALRPR